MSQALWLLIIMIYMGGSPQVSEVTSETAVEMAQEQIQLEGSTTVVTKDVEGIRPWVETLPVEVDKGVSQSPFAVPTETETPIFEVREIPQSYQLAMTDVSWKKGCPVSMAKLRLVKVGYINFQGKSMQGELVVHEVVAQEVLDIFDELYQAKYPIAKMQLIDVYDASDDASMADDNTSAFNYRNVPGSKNLSKHSYGIAIDINPVENPYKTSRSTTPEAGKKYVDRSLDAAGLIKVNDVCHKAFISRGWGWGGNWKSSKDWQHFEKNISLDRLK